MKMSMEIDQVILEIQQDEGYVPYVYLDHLGNPTIGYGTLLPLSRKEAAIILQSRGSTDTSVLQADLDHLGQDGVEYHPLFPLSRLEAGLLLKSRVLDALYELQRSAKCFAGLPQIAKEVLLNMAYNMGVPRLMGFTKMWDALQIWDFTEATNQMVDSKWFRQMHDADMQDGIDSVTRPERLASRMETLIGTENTMVVT